MEGYPQKPDLPPSLWTHTTGFPFTKFNKYVCSPHHCSVYPIYAPRGLNGGTRPKPAQQTTPVPAHSPHCTPRTKQPGSGNGSEKPSAAPGSESSSAPVRGLSLLLQSRWGQRGAARTPEYFCFGSLTQHQDRGRETKTETETEAHNHHTPAHKNAGAAYRALGSGGLRGMGRGLKFGIVSWPLRWTSAGLLLNVSRAVKRINWTAKKRWIERKKTLFLSKQITLGHHQKPAPLAHTTGSCTKHVFGPNSPNPPGVSRQLGELPYDFAVCAHMPFFR